MVICDTLTGGGGFDIIFRNALGIRIETLFYLYIFRSNWIFIKYIILHVRVKELIRIYRFIRISYLYSVHYSRA